MAESEQIIPGIEEPLTGPALQRFGQLVRSSQSLGARLLKNQVPETICLAEDACRQGAAAASAFGAGFGGSVWALVKTDEVADFSRRLGCELRKGLPTAQRPCHVRNQWRRTGRLLSERS